jgi:hypothetical protein
MEDEINFFLKMEDDHKIKNKQCNLKQPKTKNELYAVLKNSTVTSGNQTNKITQKILAQSKKQKPNQP